MSETYKDAGVDIFKADQLVKYLGITGYGSLIKLGNVWIVLSTDGVGTKLLVANELEKYDTIGIDLVAMCANDVLCHGAKPYAFLDYYATGKLNIEKSKEILKGILEGCRQAGCELVGGETAEMPGLYEGEHFDLAGFCMGVIERKYEIPKNVSAGDILIGLPSSGPHSNGFSLIRKLYKEYTEEMLTPTRIYTHNVLPIIKHINALAHITGGGIHGNLPRVLPKGTSYKLKFKYSKQWQELYKKTKFSKAEFENTFNCGWGMLVVAKKLHDTDKILDHIKDAKVIGEIIGT